MRRWLERGLLWGGLACLAVSAFVVADAEIYRAREASELAERIRLARSGEGWRQAWALRDAPEGAWGRLEIPRIGVSALVAEGVDDLTLRRAIGHLPGTPFPGEAGNVALAGHRDGVFRGLGNVREGDVVRIATVEGDFEYRVESLRVVDPGRIEVLGPVEGQVLTLITCHPFGYVGRAPNRFIVRARQAPREDAAIADPPLS